MKYVGIDVQHPGLGLTKRLVVAFPEDLVHAEVAKALVEVAVKQWPKSSVSVGSAGFMSVEAKSTHGKSESLRLEADVEDAVRFNMSDYGGNYL